MKTTIDIPEQALADAMRYTQARSKREAVVIALEEFNRRRQMIELLRHAGTCDQLITPEALQAERRQR